MYYLVLIEKDLSGFKNLTDLIYIDLSLLLIKS